MKREILCENPRIELYEGDCLEILPSFPDKSFDLVLTDPPYGINIANQGTVGVAVNANLKDYGTCLWDVKPITPEQIEETLRTSKMAILFGANYYSDKLPNSKCWIAWDKGIPKNFKKAQCELAWTNSSSYSRIYSVLWHGMIRERQEDKLRYHPTQKPTKLMKAILSDFSKDSDTILDPFAGSGTTGEAAFKLNRNCTMIKMEPKYCDIIRKRIDVLARQGRLFK